MTTEQIKKKIQVGDYILASKMLKTTPENVRTRFSRKKQDVLDVLRIIIDNRENLIREYWFRGISSFEDENNNYL